MNKYRYDPKHALTLVRECTMELDVLVTDQGNITGRPDAKPEEADCSDVTLFCSTCGHLGEDEFEDHGIATYWEEV